MKDVYKRQMPATGFALSLKLTLMALERQGETFAPPVPDVILSFAPGGPVSYTHLSKQRLRRSTKKRHAEGA